MSERVAVIGDQTSATDFFVDDRSWPARDRRRPHIGRGNYLLLSALASSLESARDRYVRPGASILDVGCGQMPYLPLFADVAGEYAGADLEPGPGIRYICTAEELSAPAASFDLVLCTQVLEHVRRPSRALEQIARVLKTGGHAFITTHGTYPFHPHPNDYWRWTQQGFEALFDDVDGLDLVELVPNRGSAACIALLIANYLEIAAAHARVRSVGVPLVAAANAIGIGLDRVSGKLHYPNPQSLIANFLLVAVKPG